MTIKRRILNICISLVFILTGILLVNIPEIGIPFAILITSLVLIIMGLGFLINYFRMARHMVGGRMQLYYGIIFMDMGLFLTSLVDNQNIVILLFLQVLYGFTGVVSILRAREAKKYGAPIWKFNLINGLINICIMVLAFVCVNFYTSELLMCYIMCAGLFYSAITRIVNAFRKTALPYIQ